MKKVNDHCMIAASGDLSDFQYICDMLDEVSFSSPLSSFLSVLAYPVLFI